MGETTSDDDDTPVARKWLTCCHSELGHVTVIFMHTVIVSDNNKLGSHIRNNYVIVVMSLSKAKRESS